MPQTLSRRVVKHSVTLDETCSTRCQQKISLGRHGAVGGAPLYALRLVYGYRQRAGADVEKRLENDDE